MLERDLGLGTVERSVEEVEKKLLTKISARSELSGFRRNSDRPTCRV